MTERKLTGTTILNYDVTEKVGEGGMGEVYKAWDKNLKRHVAIKVLKVPKTNFGEEFTQRFLSEARVLAQLKNPIFTTIYEISDKGEFPVIIMEYLEGKNLKEYLIQDRPSINEVLKIYLDAANGFQYLHDKDIFHRDIKPSNLFVTKEKELKIIDLGIAKWKEDLDSFETKTYQFIGSVNYAAPELFLMEKASASTEVYALGLSLLSSLTGNLIYNADSPSEIIKKIRTQEPELSEVFERNLPDPLKDFIFLCIEKNAKDRVKNMSQFSELLTNLLTLLSSQFLSLTPSNLNDFDLIIENKGLKKEDKKDNNIFTMTLSKNQLSIGNGIHKKTLANKKQSPKKQVSEKTKTSKENSSGEEINKTILVASFALFLTYLGFNSFKNTAQEKSPTISEAELVDNIQLEAQPRLERTIANEDKPIETKTEETVINAQYTVLLSLINEVQKTDNSSLLKTLQLTSELYKEAKEKNLSLPVIDSDGMNVLKQYFEQKDFEKCLARANFYNQKIRSKLSGESPTQARKFPFKR